MPRRIVDLSHPIDSSIPMFPGLPAPEIAALLSREESASRYAPGVSFLISRYTFAGNTGTYLDAPFHRYADGADLAALPLDRAVDLPGVVVDVRGQCAKSQRAINAEVFAEYDLVGCAVLILTGWDTRWGTSLYLEPGPFLTAEAAQAIVSAGAVLVGIDTWNIDDIEDASRPAHSILLAASIPIVENLCHIDQLPQRGFRFHAAPLPIVTGTATPVRAYAVLVER